MRIYTTPWDATRRLRGGRRVIPPKVPRAAVPGFREALEHFGKAQEISESTQSLAVGLKGGPPPLPKRYKSVGIQVENGRILARTRILKRVHDLGAHPALWLGRRDLRGVVATSELGFRTEETHFVLTVRAVDIDAVKKMLLDYRL